MSDISRAVQMPQDPAAESLAEPRFSLRSLLIATAVIAALLGVIVPPFQAARQASQRTWCSNNLKQIAMACHNYRDIYKAFPPAITYDDEGKAMHSWRVLISPFLESSGFYSAYDLDQPWNGPNNHLLGDEIPDTFVDSQRNLYQDVYYPGPYRCPAAPGSQHRMLTNYVMVIDDRRRPSNALPIVPGSKPPQTAPQSTIILVEIADTDIHWLEPRDLLLSELIAKNNDQASRSVSSYHGAICIVRADGSVEILYEPVTAERLEELLPPQAGETDSETNNVDRAYAKGVVVLKTGEKVSGHILLQCPGYLTVCFKMDSSNPDSSQLVAYEDVQRVLLEGSWKDVDPYWKDLQKEMTIVTEQTPAGNSPQ